VHAFDTTFTEALEYTAAFTPEAFPRLTQHLDPSWIDEALLATGTATLRRRRLPAERTVWLMLGMAVLRDWPVAEVARQLELALPAADGSRTVAPSALPQARQRVGAAPLEHLFVRSGAEWAARSADRDRWHGLGLYSIDGTTLRVADSEANRRYFGGQDSGRHAGGRDERTSGYPLVRVVVMMALRSHILAGAAFGPYTTDERVYARSLLESVPDRSLLLLDRCYLQADILVPLMTSGVERHWMTRAKATTKYRVVKRLGPGDDLVEFDVSQEARRAHPELPRTYRARAIRFQRKGHRPTTLLTSLLDVEQYPADELRVLYHERWEIELGIGEIKTDMLERMETIRSKSPEAVAQEMFGVLIAYNLVRLEMERIADELNVAPTRISFVAALRYFVEQWMWAATTLTPGAIPQRLSTMRDRLRLFLLPERRSERVFPRAVKVKMSNYPRKLPRSPRGRPTN
jgi:hypothetical protein